MTPTTSCLPRHTNIWRLLSNLPTSYWISAKILTVQGGDQVLFPIGSSEAFWVSDAFDHQPPAGSSFKASSSIKKQPKFTQPTKKHNQKKKKTNRWIEVPSIFRLSA